MPSDETKRTSSDERIHQLMDAGVPLHRIEQQLDHEENCRPDEADMITRPTATPEQMELAVGFLRNEYAALLAENRRLRGEITRLKSCINKIPYL